MASDIPTHLNQSRRFVGLDLAHPAYEVDDGHLTQADNVYVDYSDLITRPGKVGVLATPFMTPIYAPLPFVTSDGSTEILFSTGTKLYRHTKGTTTTTEITDQSGDSLVLDSPKVQMARAGTYAYIVDGSRDHDLLRTNLADDTGEVVSGLTPPTATSTVKLINNSLDPFDSLTHWSFSPTAPLPPAELIVNGSFEGGETGGVANGWSTLHGPADIKQNGDSHSGGYVETASGSGDWCMQLDGDEISQDITCPLLSDSSGRVRLYEFSILGHNAYSAKQTVTVTLTASDGGMHTAQLITRQHDFAPTTTRAHWDQASFIADFGFLNFEPLTITVDINNTGGHGGYDGLYIDDVSLKPVNTGFIALLDTPGFRILSNTRYTNGLYLKKDYNPADDGMTFLDLSTSQTIAFSYAPRGLITAPSLKVQLQAITSVSTVLYDVPVTFAADLSYFSMDVTTVPADVLAQVRYLYITFTDNVSDTLTGDQLANLCTIGPLTASGNLSVGYADYYWMVTELDTSVSPGDIESDPSPATALLRPTGLQAEGQLTIPAQVNSEADRFNVYRFGGTFSDGFGRLVATFSLDDVSTGTNWTWDHTTRLFIDDVPDSQLLYATTLTTGRGAPPKGAQAICQWQSRIWLSKDSDLYASWLITADNAASLYFNSVNIPDDPQAEIKGVRFSAGGADNDPIQALVPFGTFLFVLKQRSIWVVSGYDPTNLVLQSYLLDAGVGCIAPRSARVVGNKVVFLGPNGLYQFDGDVVDPRSMEIEKVLNPSQVGGGAISADAYQLAASVYHGRRLHLFAPTYGDMTNTVDYVWDSRQDGWTRWLLGNITSAASLSSSADTDDLYLAGGDGQLYTLIGAVDKATPDGSPTPISFSVTGRAYGLDSDGISYWRESRATRLYALVTSTEATTIDLGVAMPSRTWTYPAYTIQGQSRIRVKVPNDVRGDYLQVQLQGAVSTPFRITSFALETAEGTMRS